MGYKDPTAIKTYLKILKSCRLNEEGSFLRSLEEVVPNKAVQPVNQHCFSRQRFPCEVLWKTGAGSFLNVYLSGTLYHATSLGELIGGLPDLGVVCTVDFFPNAATCQLLSFDFVV